MTDTQTDNCLYLTPAGTLATLTVTLPTEANSAIGQQVEIGTTQIITALTINGATNILGNVTTLAANGLVGFRKVAANTWLRNR
jgi:UDP-3-O-[3-hydroxymyristoyl] glucosamine N-acyltransferase